MSLKNIFLKLAHDVSRYPNIVQLTNTLDHGFKEVAAHIQDGGSEVEVTPVYTSGEKLATITVDDVDKDIYMPNGEVKTMEGSSFKTVNGSLVDEMKVGFTPIQDLHGYSKPWAGGAGKNKAKPYSFTNSTGNVIFTYDGNGAVTLDGTANANNAIPSVADAINNGYTFTLPAGLYVPSLSGSTANAKIEVYDTDTTTRVSNGNAFTLSGSTNILVRVCEVNGVIYDNDKFFIQLEQGSNVTSYEPYSNICPISGHTQVQSKINDTTYTTSLGGTYYGGEVEQVSGEGESIYGIVTLDGSETWNESGTNGYIITAGNSGITDCKYASSANTWCLSNLFERSGRTWANGCFGIENRSIWIGDTNKATFGSLANFKTMLSNSPLTIVYELATPTALTLTGQNITADVGENNVSAPLDGQSIEEVKYHQMMTIQDVEKLIQ